MKVVEFKTEVETVKPPKTHGTTMTETRSTKRSFSFSWDFITAIGVVIIGIIIFLQLSGCSNRIVKDNLCDGHPESLICSMIESPKTADLAIRVVNVAALKKKIYTRMQAESAIKKMQDFNNEVRTYKEMSDFIVKTSNKLREKMGAEYIVISDILTLLDDEIPISEYDRFLLNAHFENLLKDISLNL